uniref:p21-activated protein kinase-interacting protein 1-like n=2 Tax=Lepeophtheirus salmonis TaxID=72036 RepID=D3PFV7_LEPSM|nr:p21-activated protein kinase-interacting protein 1-like [Lepeophtheirus salmonis]
MDWIDEYNFIVGTYESFIIGYKFNHETREFTLAFTDEAHSGSVRALATGGKYLLSSGSDENIKIYNLRNNKEFGSLHHSEGLVRSMVFFDSRYLFTASDDHNLYVLKTGSWKLEKTLFKHQSPVTDVSIHPSGKLALSIGDDQKLVTWNLIKGRSAYITNLRERPDLVKWSPKGDHYFVGFCKHIDIYSVETTEILYSLQVSGRSNAVAFLDDDIFLVATENPKIEVHSLKEQKMLFDFEAHEKRVRCLEVLQNNEDKVIVSVSNDGWMKLWELSKDMKEFTLLGQVDTHCRITCLKAHLIPAIAEAKEVKKTSLTQDLLEEVKIRSSTIDEEIKSVKEKRKATEVVNTKAEDRTASKKRKRKVKKTN